MRAGPTNVDCSDDAELVSTASETRNASGPSTGPDRKKNTLPWMSSLPKPNSPVPTPANMIIATASSRYSVTMVITVSVAARPGVRSGSLVSSFMVRVTSQPQKMKIDSERPAATALKDPTANGLNHARSKGVKSNALPLTACVIAAMAKNSSTATWKVTRTYWSF